MPLFHIHGIVANIGVSIISGLPVIASQFVGGEEFLKQCATANLRPTWYSAVPTMHEAILLEAEKRGPKLDRPAASSVAQREAIRSDPRFTDAVEPQVYQ